MTLTSYINVGRGIDGADWNYSFFIPLESFMWTIFKVFIEFVAILLLSYVLVLGAARRV